jgi:hypothetical protein
MRKRGPDLEDPNWRGASWMWAALAPTAVLGLAAAAFFSTEAAVVMGVLLAVVIVGWLLWDQFIGDW